MIRFGIIGAGSIFPHQIAALCALRDSFCISAVCDSNTDRLTQAKTLLEREGMAQDVRYLTSVFEFEKDICDAVLIATPPKAHYALACECLQKGLTVLLEKPAVLSMDELNELYENADNSHALLHVAYHASFAADLLWWIEQHARLNESYSLGRLTEIYCGFYDPYAIDGLTLPEKEGLLGSYIDSGVNQLSVCDRILDAVGSSMGCFTCTDFCHSVDARQNVISSETVYTSRETVIHLDTGWIYGLNRKMTVLLFAESGKQILLDHSNQRVILQCALTQNDIYAIMRGAADIIPKASDEILFENSSEPRLKKHYIGVFSDFERALSQRSCNREATYRIHRLLLKADRQKN